MSLQIYTCIYITFKKLNTKVLKETHLDGRHKISKTMFHTHIALEDLPVRQDVKMEDSDIYHLVPCRPKLMYVFVLVYNKKA